MILLLLTIKKDKFENNKQYNLFRISIILLIFVVLSSLVLPVILKDVTGDARVEGTNVSLQMKYILKYPFRYAYLLLKMTIKNFIRMFFGYKALNELGYLTSFDILTIKLIYFVNLIGLLLTSITNNEENKLNKKTKIIIGLAIFIIWLLICTALYLDWTPVGSNIIEGVNARYFLPLLLYLIVPFTIKIEKIAREKYYYMIVLLVNFANIMFLLISYYS